MNTDWMYMGCRTPAGKVWHYRYRNDEIFSCWRMGKWTDVNGRQAFLCYGAGHKTHECNDEIYPETEFESYDARMKKEAGKR